MPTLSFGGSYPNHDPAFDLYPNGLCGPHDRVPLRAPAAGTVERYSFVMPLDGGEPLLEWDRGGGGALVRMPYAAFGAPEHAHFETPCAHAVETLGTQMHIAVLKLDTPLAVGNATIKALWCGHVDGASIKTGRVAAGEVFARCGESGIEFGNGTEASHVHVCGSRSGALSPNGDVPGILVARAMGFNVRDVGRVPGPNQYFQGRDSAYRGYLGYAAWQAAGCG